MRSIALAIKAKPSKRPPLSATSESIIETLSQCFDLSVDHERSAPKGYVRVHALNHEGQSLYMELSIKNLAEFNKQVMLELTR